MPRHFDENEQITYILDSALEATLDVFCPPRRESLSGTDAYPRN